ncbi:hypothetical protein JCM33374_g6133 [Metschnikowia sp. JCM 33374]|nr:hypothetical protein JCM33374_g6133 [Metschnikowia sp. JCM 33374]
MSAFPDPVHRIAKHAQKKRIRVACNNCRKKKIKCDGAPRCMNCVISQEPECIYDEKPLKLTPKKPRAPKSNDDVSGLHSRLDRLEAMIQSLATVIPGAQEHSSGLAKQSQSSRWQSSGSDDDDDASGHNSNDDDNDSASPSGGTADLPNNSGKQNEIYLGNHSFFSILSKSSLLWMKNHLSPANAHLLVPLTNLPFVFENKTKRFVNLCFASKGCHRTNYLDLMKSPLPKKRDAMLELLEKYQNSFNAVQILCSREEIQGYLGKYYSSSNPNKRDLSLIELFKLSSGILICLSDAMETLFDDASKDPDNYTNTTPISDLTPQEIGALRTQLLEVCMCYYYQLSITGQGLDTVKAIIFFAIFFAKCCDPPEVAHMVLTQGVRKALDMGLHRIETYRNCTPEQFQTKLLVWRIICYFDMEICFRAGKPPCINYSDTSEELRHGVSKHGINHAAYPVPFLNTYDMIFEIRLETYTRLFSASADTKTFAALQRNVDHLNSKSFNLLAALPPDHRPYFFNEPGFKPVTCLYNIDDEHRLTTILTFFVNMMSINRLPMMFAFPGVSIDLLQTYRNLSLNSARSIMHLLKNFHAYGPGKAPSLWITYFPVISVLHLSAACMSDPKSPDAHSDILLILEMCNTWFSRRLPPDSFRSFKFDMSLLLQVLVQSVTNIAINIFERTTGIEIISKNEKVKDSFEAPRKFFPELFGNVETLKKSIPIILESKSPFPTDGTPASQASPSIHSHSPAVSNHGTVRDSHTAQSTPADDSFGHMFGFNEVGNMAFDQLDEFPNFFFDGINQGF